MSNKNSKLNDTFLINEELLKLHSPISKNVSVDKLIPFLTLAQPYYIEPILGKALMQELQDEIEADELSEVNKALILKIAPSLANWTTYLAMRSLAYSINEKGMTKEKSKENSEPVNDKELGEYILSIKNLAEMATELLVKYLCQCSDLYPLWRPSETCHCAQYLEENTGSSEKVEKMLIYFPKRVDDCSKGCGCK